MTYPKPIQAIVVDQYNLTMYSPDGSSITVPQGDPRIRDLVAKITPVVDRKEIYMLTVEDMEGKNYYAEVEKKSNGLVRLFKLAKSKFKEIAEKFCEPIKPQTAGTIPMATSVNGEVVKEGIPEVEQPKLPPEDQRPLTKGEAAVAEIMANAKGTDDATFNLVVDAEQAKTMGTEEEVIVAVLADNTVVHGVEQLEDQFKAVNAGVTSVDGMALFLQRAGSVQRGHSVEDLLKFVQKGELPFADDGTVLVYKRLNPTADSEVFKDCHSGNVKQRVGSFVHMAEKLVDPNRSRDCSNGLHVARRDYLHSFSGSVVVLCKLAPEDVIAVPHNDARKLRAKGYHIIARLSDKDADLVCRNKPMEDTELLANAIAGNHTPILEYVEITEGYGGGLKVTKVETPEQHAAAAVREVKSLDHVEDVVQGPTEVDARALALDLANTRATEASPLLAAPYGQGDHPANSQQVRDLVDNSNKVQAPPAGMHVTEPTGEVAQPVPVPLEMAGAGVIGHVPASFVEEVKSDLKPAHKLSERDQLLHNWSTASVPSAKLEAARAILAFKKAKKKSWTALGIPTSVWTKAQEIVEAADVGCKNAVTKADCEPKQSTMEAIDKMVAGDPAASLLGGDNSGLPDKPVKVSRPGTNAGKKKPRNDDKMLAKPAKAKGKPVQTRSAAIDRKAEAARTAATKVKKMTQQEEMAKLVKLYEVNPDKANARAIFAFKQKSKKSWEVLGVDDKAFQKKITERAKL